MKHAPDKHEVDKQPGSKVNKLKTIGLFASGILLGIILISIGGSWYFEHEYAHKVYPGISVASIPFSGQTELEVRDYWLRRNKPFQNIHFTLKFENYTATLSGEMLDIGYDATLSATQAYSVGRSGTFLTDTALKLTGFTEGINLKPLFRWNTEHLDTVLEELTHQINIAPENALLEFKDERVTAFRLAKSGRALNSAAFKRLFSDQLQLISTLPTPNETYALTLPVEIKEPLITSENANNFGIKELIGVGKSNYKGSIAGRAHNVALAAARLNGVLIPPGDTFSFNDTVGDISAATGYKQAYIIKNGRTVLDDGGGVCQVSTTIFRAALNTGLPIIERHPHSYRVKFYEQGGWKPGFDATIFAPSYDLKFKNDTGDYILIQTVNDTVNSTLAFEIYGTKDGRSVEISDVRLWDARPAPPDLYQDDPTLPNGTVKQVDWAVPGIKSEFDYEVKKNGEEIFKNTYFSNFIPWQAVYLRGTGPAQ
ncbi:VanW family protein [Candidatus Gottesmanbacteria bacterium]|nr:VanW family protein [Candidatus Gottesmanbacteria bacterium]